MTTWALIDAERTAWSDLTDSLTPAQWDTSSLCKNWRVRDVVAHVTDGSTITLGKAMATLARYGFRLNRMLEREASKGGAKDTGELRTDLRATIGMRRTPPGAKPEDVLVDLVVHQQDVRRPLGLPRSIPTETLTAVLDRLTGTENPLLPAKRRTRGLHLRATDLHWDQGEGDEVSGAGEAILLAVAGRPAALAELSGPGASTLGTRLGG